MELASADLDGDGDRDLICARRDDRKDQGFLNVYVNLGDGILPEAREMELKPPPFGIAAADLDGDGLADLAVGTTDLEGPLTLFRSAGGGEFLPPRTVIAPISHKVVRALDHDDDGDLDLTLLGQGHVEGNQFFLLPNEGAGEFSQTVLLDKPTEHILAEGDVDGDGDLDLVVDQDLHVLENLGGGTFRTGAVHPVGVFTFDLAAGDLDGDGDPDLAAANFVSETVSVLRNDAIGVFGRLETPLGFTPRAIATPDLDGDGALDVATAGGFALAWFRNDGIARLAPAADPVRIGSDPIALAAADLDGDGSVDLATANRFDNASVLLSDGGGRLGSPRNYSVSGSPTDMAAADLDGDGDVDLALPLPSPDLIQILWNGGDGSFREALALAAGNRRYSGVDAADADGDGRVDLLVRAATLDVYWNLGGGSFHLPDPDLYGVGWDHGDFQAAAAPDLDGDGDPDWVVAGNAIGIRRNTGGAFGPIEIHRCGDYCPWTPPSVATADFNGDGGIDLAFPCRNAGVCVFHSRLVDASRDDNQDGVPDECQPPPARPFRRGDADADAAVNLTDAIVILRHLFLGGSPIPCQAAADADDDGAVSLTDAVRILAFLFQDGEAPAPPFPACGVDPTPDGPGPCRYPGRACEL